ncbi:venom phosphodiesterase 2-like [Tachypleus tridentatus]|uniref:venom phosphodiesterase 2-like n=1 Tax=Tachypleus tridentatus TaxID=6853 RepID=UPI003FD69AA7
MDELTQRKMYCCPRDFQKAPLLLKSLDGFRPDYLKHNITPNINHLAKCGVLAPYVRPVFPTKTFPNHYSIATVHLSPGSLP